MREGRWFARAALAFGSLIGSGTFLVARSTTQTFEPVVLAWFRITLSALFMVALYALSGEPRRMPPLRHLKRLALLGLLGVAANQLLFLVAMKWAPAIDGALFYAMTPALVLLFGRAFLGETFTWVKVLGILLAFLGVVVVLADRGLQLQREYLWGDGLLVLAVITWALFTLLGKAMLKEYSVLTVNSWCFFFAALALLPVAPFYLGDFHWSQPGPWGWAGLGYLVVLTSVLNFSIWYWALKRMEAAEVAVFSNLQPPLTALLSWIFEGIGPSGPVWFGGALVLFGVSLVQMRRMALSSPAGTTTKV